MVRAMILTAGWMAAVCATAQEPVVFKVDGAKHHQTIDNFGASDCWSIQMVGLWSDANRNKVADLLFSQETGIGLSAWRFNIGGGINLERIGDPWRNCDTFEVAEDQYDWNRLPGQRWFLAAAKAREVPTFIAFANSPPARMTRNGFTNGTKDGGDTTNLHPKMVKPFAKYLCDIVRHFRDNPVEAERITFQWIAPINEPQIAWNETSGQEGCTYGNRDMVQLIMALRDQMDLHGLADRTNILAPESNTYWAVSDFDFIAGIQFGAAYGDYMDELAGYQEISPYLGNVVCAHAYGSALLDGVMVPIRERLRKKLDEYPGWRFWQSEYCVMDGPNRESGGGRDLTMTTALWVARLMHCDLTIVNASAWQWWTAVSRVDYKDGLIYTNYNKTGDEESIIPSKLLWTFGNFSRFLRPGTIRLDSSGANDIHGLMGTAWLDAHNERLMAVFVNMSDQPREVALQWSGLDKLPATFTPYITSDAPGDDLRPCDPVPAQGKYTVPAKAVVTLVGKLG